MAKKNVDSSCGKKFKQTDVHIKKVKKFMKELSTKMHQTQFQIEMPSHLPIQIVPIHYSRYKKKFKLFPKIKRQVDL